MSNMHVLVFVQGVVEKSLEIYSKVKDVFVDMKHERTFFKTKIAEEDGAITPLYGDAPKPDWFQIQIPGHPGQLVGIVGDGKVILPIIYEKEGEKKAKLILRNGTVVHSWYRQIRAVYFAVQFRNGHPYLMKDERFIIEVPDYINDVAAVEDFLRKQGISEDLARVASKLSLVSPKQGNSHRDKHPNNGINLKKKDDLPGVMVAQSEPEDENPTGSELSDKEKQDMAGAELVMQGKGGKKGNVVTTNKRSDSKPRVEEKKPTKAQLLAEVDSVA